MELKLRARLSAYSKLDSVSTSSLGTVDKDQIDTLFKPSEPEIVNKSQIDSLFPEEENDLTVDKSSIDTLFDDNGDTVETVSRAAIDSLFN